ncbi:MAG: cadmium-translocating P-type ATPase [Acidaminococcaceae bacterium]|jgi:Cd2+/Zn2+-exporting ATPase|nr:cadmium-translocating P-type ATPase [Acidaminococcaceae bacterium]
MSAGLDPATAICPRCGRTLANCVCEEDFSFSRPPVDAEAGAEAQTEKLTLLAGAVLFAGVEIYQQVLHLEGYSPVQLGILVAAYLILGSGVLVKAAKNLLQGDIFDENFLMSLATLGAFAIRQYPEAVGVMLFYRVGELFEDLAVSRSRAQISAAVDLRPEVVNLVTADGIQVVPAAQAQVDDVVLVRPGDRIPLDGVVVDGRSQLDTSAVTGEPVPVQVRAGTEVLSGCVNVDGALKVKVAKILQESMVSRILNSVQDAAAGKPKLDRFITRFSHIYTPIVIVLALITAFGIPAFLHASYYPWIYTALTFLVMSCPCALVLSVPLAFFCGIGAGSGKGILIKNGAVLEALSKVKAVVMDKTGTITKGNFVVQQLAVAGSWQENEVLQLAASTEQASTHPIGRSILAEAQARGVTLLQPDTVEELAGHGLKATLQGRTVLCGNAKFLTEQGVTLPEQVQEQAALGTQVLVAVAGVYAGAILVADTVKADAAAAIKVVRDQGVQTVMLTGDAEGAATAVAQQVGIQEVHARLLPEEKLQELKKIRAQHGSVMFIGDGINDAPVLAGADVGAAMGSGADAAIESADVVFMNSRMQALPLALQIANRTMQVARQNVWVALTIKIIVFILGLTGIYANMWLAVFADTGVAILCILNSVRILYMKVA